MNVVLNEVQSPKNPIEEMRESIRHNVRRYVEMELKFSFIYIHFGLDGLFWFSLLERTRPSVEEIYPSAEFVWKDDPKKVITNNKGMNRGGTKKTDFRYRKNDVFPPHSLEVLPAQKEEVENEEETEEERKEKERKLKRGDGDYLRY